ncbi:MAG: hypothetical protein QW117_01850 [Candidatus Pacearchaeota archaeon]
MKIYQIIKSIENNKDFLNLKTKYPKMFLYAIFYVFEEKNIICEFDYYLERDKIAIFSIKENIIKMKISKMNEIKNIKKPSKLKKICSNFEDIKEIIYKEFRKNEIRSLIEKIILILINEKNENIWKVNCITKSLDIINMEVLDKNKEINKFDRKSLFDFIKFNKK